MAKKGTPEDPEWLRNRVTRAMEEAIAETSYKITDPKCQKAIDWCCRSNRYKLLRGDGQVRGNDKTFAFDDKITRLASVMKCSKEEAVKLALRNPLLFNRKPDSLDDNIERFAKLINVSRKQVIDAAFKYPAILDQVPKTMNDNITRFAQLMDVSKERAVEAALKYPALFIQSPETLYGNYLSLQHLYPFTSQGRDEYKRSVTQAEFLERALKRASIISASKQHIHLRLVVAQVEAHFEPKPLRGLSAFFMGRPGVGKQDATNAVVAYYANEYNQKAKGASTIACMIARGSVEQEHWEKSKNKNRLSDDFIALVEARVDEYQARYQQNFGATADDYEETMKTLTRERGKDVARKIRQEGSEKTKALMEPNKWERLSSEQRRHVHNTYRLTTPISERFPPKQHLLHLQTPQAA